MNHTPGPWIVEGLSVKAVDHGIWFKVAGTEQPKLTKDGRLANARLIASAPDLLEALEALVSRVASAPRFLHPVGMPEVEKSRISALEAAEQAIARAKGQT